MEHNNLTTPASFSIDGRFMHIDAQRVDQNYIYTLLQTLGSVDSHFVISYFSRGEEYKIASEELGTDDPYEDDLFALSKSEELITADFIEVEKVLEVPQIMTPGREYIV